MRKPRFPKKAFVYWEKPPNDDGYFIITEDVDSCPDGPIAVYEFKSRAVKQTETKVTLTPEP